MIKNITKKDKKRINLGMKIITLIENTLFNGFLLAEHGLSVYIEDKVKILIDTGQGKNYIDNAKKI